MTGVVAIDGSSVRFFYERPEAPGDLLFEQDGVDDDGMGEGEPAYVAAARRPVEMVDFGSAEHMLVTVDLGHVRPVAAEKSVAGQVVATKLVRNQAYREQSGQNWARRKAQQLRQRTNGLYEQAEALSAASPRRMAAMAAHVAALRASGTLFAAYHNSAARKRLEFDKVRVPRGRVCGSCCVQLRKKTSWLDRTANSVLAVPKDVKDVKRTSVVIGDGGVGTAGLRGRKAPVKGIRTALVRAVSRINASGRAGLPSVRVVVLAEYRTTKQASAHDDRVDLKDKKGRVRYKDGSVRASAWRAGGAGRCGAPWRGRIVSWAAAAARADCAAQSRVTGQSRVKICTCGQHAATARRTGGVLHVDRDLDACASMRVIMRYAAEHDGARHPAYAPI